MPAAHRLPAIYEYAFLAHDGGLMAYGPNMDAIFDRAAGLADQILKGASPADLPLELPTRFDLAVNLKTAKTLEPDDPGIDPGARRRRHRMSGVGARPGDPESILVRRIAKQAAE